MNAESSHESDISDSWFLVDVNLNEESLSTADVSLASKKCDSVELNNFISRSINKTESEGVETCNKVAEVQPFQSLDDDQKNDSGDAESIEILDMDGNYQDSEFDRLDLSVIDHFNFAAYHSDDEESGDRVHDERRSNSSTVIKRKKRKADGDLQDSVHYPYSENACVSDVKEMGVKINQVNNHPVYKHYRNNVANAVLSMSVGVIFAGVACIAIGHFLGVQNATETAVELVETLKKLQVENAALQSSIFHLKKAILNLETNSKLEIPLHKGHNKVFCEETSEINSSNGQRNTDFNNAALSEICSSLNSIEWLSKLQNTPKKGTETENREILIKGFGRHIHDQLNLLKQREKGGTKVSADPDLLLVLKKLLIVLKKIMKKLSSSHDNIEVMHERLAKLKPTINHSFSNNFLDSSKEMPSENRVPVTEFDLKKIHWNDGENSESRVWYKFPQPEKYYDLKERASNKSLTNDVHEKKFKESDKEQTLRKKNYKKEREVKNKKKSKKQKHRSEKFEKTESEFLKRGNGLDQIYKSDSLDKKKQEKNIKHKRRNKNIKSSKLKRVLLSKGGDESDFKKKHLYCSESQCFNLTGYWVFKWADGREEFRRHQTLSDWQFDRAKARKDGRNVGMNSNWQFERAKARKEFRDEGFDENWNFKRASGKESSRKGHQSRRGKSTKYYGKEFFQERFS